jgi:cytochrome c oxidase subunit II
VKSNQFRGAGIPVLAAAAASLFTAAAMPQAARSDTPLSYLGASGARAYPINSLLWGLIIVSVVVVIMAIVLVIMGTFRGRALPGDALPGRVPVELPAHGISWIIVGTGTSTLVLFGAAVWTVVTLAAVASPPGHHADLNLEVIGHQWWWEVRYKDPSPTLTFKTANEIHIPVGRTVAVDLRTADVIHSFWVPSLTGKTDLIPGQVNETWFSASRPGVYRGQCTEYCGRQHAHMAFQVIADDPDSFKAWRDHAVQPAPPPVSSEGAADFNTFVRKCGACHSVAGTRAGGVLGPDLSHLMSRRTIAAGTLPNSIGHLSAWIADPQHVKPGAYMPRLDISGPELTRVRRFLLTLQ